jgi:hypothetical protein
MNMLHSTVYSYLRTHTSTVHYPIYAPKTPTHALYNHVILLLLICVAFSMDVRWGWCNYPSFSSCKGV